MDEKTAMLCQAYYEYKRRKDRLSHPDGTFDNKSRWYPSSSEVRKCCLKIRNPSAKWPYSLMKHCRSLIHVANLYGVDPSELRKIGRSEEYRQWLAVNRLIKRL